MFVKIIKKKDNNISINDYEKVYDCCRVGLFDHMKDENGKLTNEICLIFDVGGQSERTITLEKENLQVIYMNNQGKTIDRKVW